MASKDLQLKAKNNAPGVLITFEGGDGSGKSTHIKFLAGLLQELGFDVLCIREPGGTEIGEKLREVLLDIGNEQLADEAELLIYEACRAQLIKEVIAPALAKGSVVLCDRFTDSTIAYQGYGRGLDIDFIKSASDFATGGIAPDVTIMLTCADRAQKQSRVDRREKMDRIELAGDDFHTNVINAFTKIAEDSNGRIRVIETGGKHSETARSIFEALSDVAPWLSDGSLDLAPQLDAYDAAHDHSKDKRSVEA